MSVILNARIAIAASIAHNVERVYAEAKEQFKNGILTESQLAARLVTLKKKPILPEEIEVDLIEDSMNFSPEYLSRYEEEVKETADIKQEEKELRKKIVFVVGIIFHEFYFPIRMDLLQYSFSIEKYESSNHLP